MARGLIDMDAIAMVLLACAGLYGGFGLACAIAFVVCGVSAVQSAPVSLGARILIFPGAVALWPLVLSRWRSAHAQGRR